MSNTYKGYQSITSKAMKAEMLEPDVELELARNWHQKGCEKSLHRLVNAYMRLAVSMASKYVKYGVDTNELIQEAGIGKGFARKTAPTPITSRTKMIKKRTFCIV